MQNVVVKTLSSKPVYANAWLTVREDAVRRWEFPGGSFDQPLDANPAALAARELGEETGLVAGTITLLGTLDITPSTFNQRCWVFRATDLSSGQPHRDPEEHDMRSAWFPRTDVERMIGDGTICDAMTTAAYTLLLLNGQSRDV